MRKIVISFCILLAALSLKAQTVSGIRIDGGDTPILVYLGGNQMCLPTTTCFVANLKSGYYTVEVYATRSARPGERVWKGRRLYNDRTTRTNLSTSIHVNLFHTIPIKINTFII